MKIRIKYFAALADQSDKTQEELEVDHRSVEALYKSLKAQYNFTYDFSEIRVAVNQHYVTDDVVLKDGDEVVFITPVAGG